MPIPTFDHSDFPLQALLEAKRQTVSVVLPAREVADTVGSMVERIAGLGELVDQILVVDATSVDRSATVAAEAGAEVVDQDALIPDMGPVLGKGDAMWRALAAVRGDLVVFIDADTADFSPAFVAGLLGPLFAGDGTQFVKATYSRPYTAGGACVPDGGGRVSQLAARPLLAAFYPALADLVQPLAGEVAAPRELLESIPFTTGYSVEMAMLLELHDTIGPDAFAQVDLGERRNAHQSLQALRPMAESVLAAVTDRLRAEGRLLGSPAGSPLVTRPPFRTLAPA